MQPQRCIRGATRTDTYIAPPPHPHQSASQAKKEREFSTTYMHVTSSANAIVLCTEAKSSRWTEMTRFARNVAIRSTLPGVDLNGATSRSKNSSNCLRAASARCRLRQAMMRVRPEQGYPRPEALSQSTLPDGGKTGRAPSGIPCARS